MSLLSQDEWDELEAERDAQGRFPLTVPFNDKDDAKGLGARWDKVARSWYVPRDLPIYLFARWIASARSEPRRDRPRPRPIEKPALPTTRAGRLARYYRLVLEQTDLDKLVDASSALDVPLAEVAKGALTTARDSFVEFWEQIKEIERASPEPARVEDTDDPANGTRASSAVDQSKREGAAERPELPEQRASVMILLTLRGPRRSPYVLAAVPAELGDRGALYPVGDLLPAINTAHFEPQEQRREPLLGTRDELGAAMGRLSWSDDSTWEDAWNAFSTLFGEVNPERAAPSEFAYEGQKLQAVLVPYENQDAMVRFLKLLYGELWRSSESEGAELYRSICELTPAWNLLDGADLRRLSAQHSGHMTANFGLDPSQREAVCHLLAVPQGRALAVSGPPGTGKTACLRGVIATEFVNATLADGGPRPAVIVASSATNQAVTNIIQAFGEVADAPEREKVGSRWLSVLSSYGWYYASSSKAKGPDAQRYQLLDRRDGWLFGGAAADVAEAVSNEEHLRALARDYLRLFRRNFPGAVARNVEQATETLLATLQQTARGHSASGQVPTLPVACAAATTLCDAIGPFGLRDRYVCKRRLVRRERRAAFVSRRQAVLCEQATLHSARIESITTLCLGLALPRFPFRKPAWLVALVLWVVGMFQRKRRAQLAHALAAEYSIAELTAPDADLLQLASAVVSHEKERLSHVEVALARLTRRASVLADADESWVEKGRDLTGDIPVIERAFEALCLLPGAYLDADVAQAWHQALEAGTAGRPRPEGGALVTGAWDIGDAVRNGGHASGDLLRERLEQLLDCTVRRRCFDLAARFWEGRWLLEDHFRPLPRDRDGLVCGLRRQCMLAPVIVATAHRLPKLFQVGGGGEDIVLGAADLLIIDEAGQAPPALAAGLFGLSRRAMVVGDVEQLKPIWGISAPQDAGLLRRAELADDSDWLSSRGLLSSAGSAMLLAQGSSAFADEDGSGVTLTRHYRCRPTVIEFCNVLVYRRSTPLEPVRAPDPEPLFPPMSFVECRSSAGRAKGSAINREEAATLVRWLVQNRGAIESRYNTNGERALSRSDPEYRDLGDLVAIVTPFSAQRDHLIELVKKAFPGGERIATDGSIERRPTAERMTIGTVHALQGAERPIVLFSATNSPDDGKAPFMDANPDMLNVAVSRAKETFVLFGHPELFFAPEVLKASNRAPSAVLGRYLRAHG